MKKILSALLVLTICLSLVACKQTPEQPVQQYESLEEINDQANVNICKPAAMGITDEKFYMVDNNTAAYQFVMNGYKCYIRGCRDLVNDMSDLFVDGKGLFEGCEEKISFGEAQGYKACRFILGNRQYIFGINDKEEMQEDYFESQAHTLIQQMINDVTLPEIKELVGEYQDSTYERASMTAELSDINKININIKWSSSASSYDEWNCICYINMGKAVYDTITHTSNVIDEDGNITPTTLDDYKDGYFSLKENKILWDGSSNKETSTCIFEKIN